MNTQGLEASRWASHIGQPSDYAAFEGIGCDGCSTRLVRFFKRSLGTPIDQWSFTWIDSNPRTMALTKPFLFLKTSSSPVEHMSQADRDAALYRVGLVENEPIIIDGLKFRETQKRKANRPRGKVDFTGKTLNQVIGALATKHEYRDFRPGGGRDHSRAGQVAILRRKHR